MYAITLIIVVSLLSFEFEKKSAVARFVQLEACVRFSKFKAIQVYLGFPPLIWTYRNNG